MTYRLEKLLARGAKASRVMRPGPTCRLFEDVILEPRLFGGRLSLWEETERDVWRRPLHVFVFGRRRAAAIFEHFAALHRDAARRAVTEINWDELNKLTDQLLRTVETQLLRDLVQEDPCSFDHDGNCQAHMWFGDGECPQARLKRVLAR